MLVHLLLMKRRSVYGLDGADQMFAVIFLGLAVYKLMPPGSIASTAGLVYIAAQTVLSYLIAGSAKLKGPAWRSGTAIAGIMTTKIYGNSLAAGILRGRAALGRIACWSVIVFELTFVGVLLVDRPALWVMLAVGVLFHAGIAALMGAQQLLSLIPRDLPCGRLCQRAAAPLPVVNCLDRVNRATHVRS